MPDISYLQYDMNWLGMILYIGSNITKNFLKYYVVFYFTIYKKRHKERKTYKKNPVNSN